MLRKGWDLGWQLLDEGGTCGWSALCPGLVLVLGLGQGENWVDDGAWFGTGSHGGTGTGDQGLVLGLVLVLWTGKQEPGRGNWELGLLQVLGRDL